VSGSGWTGYDSITVSLVAGTGSTFMCFTSANAGGDIAAQTCTVPGSIPEGSYTLSATDGTLTATTPFTLHPGVSVLGFDGSDVLGVAAGQSLTLTGSGFAPSSSLKATFNGTAVALKPTVTTNTVGQFTGTGFVVPATTVQGRYPLVIKDAAGNSSTVHLDVYAATLTATPSPGVAGAAIALSGSGWPINDPLRVQLDLGTGATFVCFAGTDGNGTLNQSCTVPTSLIEGAYSLVVEDNSLAVTTPFTLDPGVTISNSSGQPFASAAPGTAAELSGSGFDADSTIASVTFGTHAVAFSPKPESGPTGSFSDAAFTIPSVAPGVYTVTVKDAAGHSGTVPFTIT
jgi:hypothetical protein